MIDIIRIVRKMYLKMKGNEFLTKILISNSYIFTTQFCKFLIFQIINSVRNNISLKYNRFNTIRFGMIQRLKNLSVWQELLCA